MSVPSDGIFKMIISTFPRCLCCLLWIMCALNLVTSRVEEDTKYWKKLGREAIENALKDERNTGIAKNVILFVGDGMGISTITAGRIYNGQLDGKPGEEGYLSFEKFRNVGLLKTYNVDRQVPDSAGTATALFSGIKANYYMLGFDATAPFNVCRPAEQKKAEVSSVMDWAIEAGKSTGVVTTTRLTHATPAAAYAHCPHRDWECDTKIPEEERALGCKDIARQMIEDEPGRSINVLLGGGEQVFRASVNKSSACHRGDGKDLVFDWMNWQKGKNRTFRFVQNKRQLLDVPNDTNNILGLFAPSHLPYDMDRDTSDEGQPSLAEMVTKGIEMLGTNPKGYVLLVEGGRIDHAHHDNYAKIALEEVVAFNKAIETAVNMTEKSETLIMVTADHSHSFAINGYPKRGNNIWGIGDVTPEGFAYQTLSYINGPGYTHHRHEDPNATNRTATLNTWVNLNDTKETLTEKSARYQQHQAGYWMDSETHGGEDVGVYATGPMAHLVHGVNEQTHVPYTIAYSACIGPYLKECRWIRGGGHTSSSSSNELTGYFFLSGIIAYILQLRG